MGCRALSGMKGGGVGEGRLSGLSRTGMWEGPCARQRWARGRGRCQGNWVAGPLKAGVDGSGSLDSQLRARQARQRLG